MEISCKRVYNVGADGKENLVTVSCKCDLRNGTVWNLDTVNMCICRRAGVCVCLCMCVFRVRVFKEREGTRG